MCGRFTHRYTWKQLHRLMRITADVPQQELLPRYNVAPTQTVPVVRQDRDGSRTAVLMRWGLVPFWADDPSIGNGLINARSEEAATKPAFRAAVKKRRCLVPASDFYEWQALPDGKRKQPWVFRVKGEPLFAFAGLWERWGSGETAPETFTILTGPPNELVAPIHNRMPVILPPEMYDEWLDSARETMPELTPFPAEAMEAYPVGTGVDSPKNDDATLLAPSEEGAAPEQDRGLWGPT